MEIDFIPVGYNARLFPGNWRPFVSEIEFSVTHGFEAIHISDRKGGVDEAQLGDSLEVVGERLRRTTLIPTLEILVLVHANGRTAADATPLDALIGNLPAIEALGFRFVHWHIAPAERMDLETVHRLEQEFLPQFVRGTEIAAEQGFVLGLEHNTPQAILLATPQQLGAVLDQVPALTLVWDTNHSVPEHVDGYLQYAARMSMLHISDTPLPVVNHHLPLGKGTIDFVAYSKGLARVGFDGPAILEIGGLPHTSGLNHDTDEALVDSAERWRHALREARKNGNDSIRSV